MWIYAYFFEKTLYKPHKTIYNALVNNKKQRIVKNKQRKSTKWREYIL